MFTNGINNHLTTAPVNIVFVAVFAGQTILSVNLNMSNAGKGSVNLVGMHLLTKGDAV